MIMVNCDKREREYKEHLKEMEGILTIPYNASDELIAGIETASNADIVPKMVVFSVARGFEKPVCADIKGAILKNEAVADAFAAVEQKITDGEAAFDKKEDE